MTPPNIKTLSKTLSTLEVTPDIDKEEAMKSINIMGSFNDCMLGLVRFSGQTSWERHPAGEELLQILSGKTNITILADEGPIHISADEGSVVTIPKGLWHSQCTQTEVTLLFATPAAGSEHSTKADPR